MDTTKPTAVALDDATVAFRLADNRVYTAVEQARLTVEHGEFVAIVGPTGCGKTRLLSALADVGAQALDLEDLARHRGSPPAKKPP